MWMDMIITVQTHKDPHTRQTHMAGRHTNKGTDNTWPYRSRASLTSSFALECVVARTLL